MKYKVRIRRLVVLKPPVRVMKDLAELPAILENAPTSAIFMESVTEGCAYAKQNMQVTIAR